MTNKIWLDLNRPEAHGSTLLLHIGDHLNEAVQSQDPDLASSVASSHTTSCPTGQTLLAREESPSRDPYTSACRDQRCRQPHCDMCVQSTTVPSFSKGDVSHLSTIRIATYTTPPREASPIASTAAATINIQSQETSNRDPMRFREKQCSIRLKHCHKEYPMHCMHQL